MIKPFDFYFDFVSPYSFLAHKQLKKIENKEGIKIRYNPVLLGGLHNLHGIKAPAFIPAKAKHMIRDCKLIAEKNDIRFKFNSYFPIRSLNLMRGVLVAEEDNIKSNYIDSIFGYCVWILQVIGDVTGMGYNLANLVIFVILQPGLILLFFILWLLEKRKNKKFI